MEEGRHGGCGLGGSMVDEGLERVEGVGVMCSFLEFSFTGEVSRGGGGWDVRSSRAMGECEKMEGAAGGSIDFCPHPAPSSVLS